MKLNKKTILVSLAMLIVCSVAAIGMGALWYARWWDVPWIPTPPICRFVLPARIVGYHVIHDEMVCWSFLLVAAGFLLEFRRARRTQNKMDAPNLAITPQFHVQHHWRGVGEPER